MEQILMKYVRNNKNKPIGMVVAIKNPKSAVNYNVGWSLCHKKDKWDKDFAKKIATARAKAGRGVNDNTPLLILKEIEGMEERAERYFKAV